MRKLTALLHISLDGFATGPKGEMNFIGISEELFDYFTPNFASADTAFYGPATYRMMEAHWPAALKDPKSVGHQRYHAEWYAKSKIFVFSTKLKSLESGSAHLISENIASQVNTIKSQAGKDIVLVGSPRLIHSFMQLKLVDELLLSVTPVLVGNGIPAFKDNGERVGLRLLKSTAFKNGVLGLHYGVDRG